MNIPYEKTEPEITVTIDMHRILNGLGINQPNNYMSFSDEDKLEAMRRVDKCFQRTDPLNTIAVISGWVPGMMKYNVAWHVRPRAVKMYEITSDGRMVEVV
jgi:hypothetical protein